VIPYSPLGAGFLTGKYREGQSTESARARSASRHFNERNWALLNTIEAVGKEKGGYTISQIALIWLLSDPIITSPIIGSRALEQLKDNLGATGVRLTQDEKQRLDEASRWE
jgi:aryl-alcohol dehydrogenase-like predicted oxidoreductase